MKNEGTALYLRIALLVILLAVFSIIGRTHNEKTDLTTIKIDIL